MTRILELDHKGDLWLVEAGPSSETSKLLGAIGDHETYLMVPAGLRDRYAGLLREWMARCERRGGAR